MVHTVCFWTSFLKERLPSPNPTRGLKRFPFHADYLIAGKNVRPTLGLATSTIWLMSLRILQDCDSGTNGSLIPASITSAMPWNDREPQIQNYCSKSSQRLSFIFWT